LPLPCRNKHNCENPFKDKILVMDTSSLLNIFNTAICGISESIPENQRFHNFRYTVDQILVSIQSCCFGARIHVTLETFNDEMAPLNPDSTIRNHASFRNVCDDNPTSYSIISRTLKRVLHIQSSNISQTEIRILEQQAGSGPNIIYRQPSNYDFGLLALAFKLSIERETVLLTDDTNLQKAYENICTVRHFTLFSETIDTMRVFSTSSLSYLKDIYGCCKIINKDYFCLIDTISSFIEVLKSSSNPLHLLYERERDQIVRDVSRFNK
jgi:rRNA maturation endonuclease Nob1